ncbi:MAG: DUF1667 domain-containing protein [Eggerthellaceae bacterium]
MQVAAEVIEYTCICCPLGCQLEVSFEPDGTVREVTGNTCPRGCAYAIEEATNPVRMVTAIVCAKETLEPLSVKTATAIPKQKISEVLAAIADLELAAPICAGQVLISDVCGTGVALIATKNLP